MKLSVIIVFANEWPQVVFTIRSIAEELFGRVDFEIIAVDNFCRELEQQGVKQDRASEHIKSMSRFNPWLKYEVYKEKLSHWNAKRVGAQKASGEILLFIDAHCIPGRDSLVQAFFMYEKLHSQIDGTLHLPLTYHILEPRKLIYKEIIDKTIGDYHYSFLELPKDAPLLMPVPAMSTCGMFITRKLYNYIGGFPTELGIYGGGENFINYALAVAGKNKCVYTKGVLHHHADKRGYRFNEPDRVRNRILATYIVFGKRIARSFAESRKEIKPVLREIFYNDVIGKAKAHRELVKQITVPMSRQTIPLGKNLTNNFN